MATSLLQLLFVAIICRKISLWLWKSLENSVNFFVLLRCTLLPMVGSLSDDIAGIRWCYL